MQTNTEHRVHRRVECLLVPADREHVPVWVFKPTGAEGAHAGLVLDISDGGLRVLTGRDDEPTDEAYEVQLLLGEDTDVARFRSGVTRVWTRPSRTPGYLSGFRFDDHESSAEMFIRTYQATGSKRRWVRCLLLPR